MHRDSRHLRLVGLIALLSACATSAPRGDATDGPSATASVEPSPASPVQATREPTAAPSLDASGPAGDGPWVAYIDESDDGTSRIMVVGVDDGKPTRLIDGDHNGGFCHSADGSLIAFWSDEEAPSESFLYVANADGSARRKVSENAEQFWCGFSRAAILVRPRTDPGAVLRHDLDTGQETPFLEGAEQLQASADGTRYLAVVQGSDGPGLEVVEDADGARTMVHGPLAGGETYAAMTWSSDGSLVFFVVRPADGEPGQQSVYVASSDSSSEPRLLATLDYTPARPDILDLAQLSVSPDGRQLLVVTAQASTARPAVVVDVQTGDARTLASDAVWADWHPADEGALAVATPESLSVIGSDGDAREITAVPEEGICPDCVGEGAPPGEWGWGEWIGWSPDGRYIGLPDFAPAIVVVSADSGELQILATDDGDGFVFGPRWLR